MQGSDSRLVVISGGPGAGKTTLLLALERRGLRCVEEVARRIIQEQMQADGDALPWGDQERYCRMMLERSVDSYCENALGAGVSFFDRGIPDTLCYARLMVLPLEEEIMGACHRYRYWRRVFLAPPWEEIYETDGERKQSYAEAVITYERMVEAYTDCGYECVEIPRDSVEGRVEFVLSVLQDEFEM
jgi:predicted ATPase